MSEWRLEFDGYEPDLENHYESICAVGNGYLVVRACAAEARRDVHHYPGMYVAGFYDRITCQIEDTPIASDELVNLPDARGLAVVVDGLVVGPDVCEILEYRRTLDMQRGITVRRMRLRDEHGRVTRIETSMLASLVQDHVIAISLRVEAENWTGTVTVEGWIDGATCNDQVEADRLLGGQHLDLTELGSTDTGNMLVTGRSRGLGTQVAVAARMRAHGPGGLVTCAAPSRHQDEVRQTAQTTLVQGHPLVVEKTIAVYTSQETTAGDPRAAAISAVERAATFETLEHRQAAAWALRWHTQDTRLLDQPDATRLIRLHLFHLFQTTGEHHTHADIGIPARGWHGEGYRGHVFWDDLLAARVLDLRVPAISRSVLLYRYRRLTEAKRRARSLGAAGALFPWRSASDGREETPALRLNRFSHRWYPDHTALQRHLASAVAYGAWGYYRATGDSEFLLKWGAELIIEVARLWASLAQWDECSNRYRILRVCGPDEYHYAYLGAAEPGIDDDAYTNIMAVWVLQRALEVLNLFPPDRRDALCVLYDIRASELHRWREIAAGLRVGFLSGGEIEEFSGYESLLEFDAEAFSTEHPNLTALDEYLEASGDSALRYRMGKQVGVLMLMYVLPPGELITLLSGLGYLIDEDTIARSIAFYSRRSFGGSTLAGVVHAWIAARYEHDDRWIQFTRALQVDIDPSRETTTAAGIHLGAMAGTIDIVQRVFAGVTITPTGFQIEPRMPPELSRIELGLYVRGHYLRLGVEPKLLEISAAPGCASPLEIVAGGQKHVLRGGEDLRIDIAAQPQSRSNP